ncbi:hypothetical protein CH063_12485, partial [Colletotrichum higginsianum]
KGKGKHGQGPFRGLRFTASRFRRVILGLQITSHLFLLLFLCLPGCCRRCRTLNDPHRGREKGERRVMERKGRDKKKTEKPRKKNCIVNTMEYPGSMAALTCPTVCRSPAGEREPPSLGYVSRSRRGSSHFGQTIVS